MNEKLIKAFEAVLSKEGIVGALLVLMICSLLWEHHLTTNMQGSLNGALEARLIEATQIERKRLDVMKELAEHIKELAERD